MPVQNGKGLALGAAVALEAQHKINFFVGIQAFAEAAKDVECQDANVEVAGSGDSVVYASNQIVFDSYGSGEVEVYGKPKSVIDKEARRRSKINIH